jgi:hypothetical protein
MLNKAIRVDITSKEADEPDGREAGTVGSSLGTSRLKVQECKVWGQGLREGVKRFEPAELQQSSDCYLVIVELQRKVYEHFVTPRKGRYSIFPSFTVPNLETGDKGHEQVA